MRYTQFLIFEIGTECNLGHQHARCPNRHRDRYRYVNTARPMTDRLIVETAVQMYREFGFRGLVGWHYYNEPLCDMARMLSLMSAICDRASEARFVLWSNGTLLPLVQDGFQAFEQAYLTDYGNLSKPRVSKLRQRGVYVEVCRWPLDDRLTADSGPVRHEPCGRMFTEFIFDYYGNVHLCCYDWRGLASPGNIHSTPLEKLVADWQAIRGRLSGERMDPTSPVVCLRCRKRGGVPNFDKAIAADARVYVAAAMSEPPPPPGKIGVVFVHYRMPRHRLSGHLAWNAEPYADKRVHVYVVAESPMQLPSRMATVVVPAWELPILDRRTVFSVALTKNRGIKAALDDGCELVIVTDSCVAFPPETWQRMSAVRPGEAIIPVYRKVMSYEARNAAADDEPGMTGTIAMRTEDWQGVRFNEECKGYGAEDGQLLKEIRSRHIGVERDSVVWHIAHDPAAKDQVYVPGRGRADCWNRDTDFNPDNYKKNKKAGRC